MSRHDTPVTFPLPWVDRSCGWAQPGEAEAARAVPLLAPTPTRLDWQVSREWEALVDRGLIGSGPPPVDPAAAGGDLRFASLEAILRGARGATGR